MRYRIPALETIIIAKKVKEQHSAHGIHITPPLLTNNSHQEKYKGGFLKTKLCEWAGKKKDHRRIQVSRNL